MNTNRKLQRWMPRFVIHPGHFAFTFNSLQQWRVCDKSADCSRIDSNYSTITHFCTDSNHGAVTYCKC